VCAARAALARVTTRDPGVGHRRAVRPTAEPSHQLNPSRRTRMRRLHSSPRAPTPTKRSERRERR
jgi:hypothetical protein